MMIAAVSLALFSGLWPHHRDHARAIPPRGQVGEWAYEVKTDNFTGQVVCALKGHDKTSKVRMAYFNGVAAFRFDHVDVEDSVYRVDYGNPHSALNQAEGNLGWVFVPAASLAHARQILIRPNPNLEPKMVLLKGLDEALGITAGLGCSPTSYPQPELAD